MTSLQWMPAGEGQGVIATDDGHPLARYSWLRANHPYFDELRPLQHAGVMTNHAPYDHRWHHGLWWSWKFVNEVLFWEDHIDYGGNRVGLGRSVVVGHEVTEHAGSVVIEEALEWRTLAGDVLLTEARTLVASSSDTSDGAWQLDWDQTWTPQEAVRLESTPWPAASWGGYAGLNYRPARSMAAEESILGEGVRGAEALHGMRSPWAAYTGLVDGAENDVPQAPARGGVALLQHPENPRYPDPVYTFSATDGFGFLATAPLMRDPLELARSESLRLRNRVIVFGSAPDESELAASHARYQEPSMQSQE